MESGNIEFASRNLSYSQITTWFQCRHKHRLQYIEGWQPRQDQIPLLLGTFVHEALAAIISGKYARDVLEQMVEEQRPNYDEFWVATLTDTMEQAIDIADRTDEYMGISAGHWETERLPDGTPLVEYKLNAPVHGWQGYVGIADWVATDKHTGKTWLIDWKTRNRMYYQKDEEVNLQLMSYLYLLRSVGVEVDGAAIVQILSKMPAQPKVNKNGTMSRTKITTDWPTYRAALEDNGLNPDDYLDMKEKLDTAFFDFVELYFSDQEVENAWKEIILPVSIEIRDEGVDRYRSMSPFNCRYCPYRQPCVEGLRGYDAQGTLEMYFDRREENESVPSVNIL